MTRDSSSSGAVKLYANDEAASFRYAFKLPAQDEQRGMLDSVQMRRMFISAAEIRERIESTLGPMEPAEIITLPGEDIDEPIMPLVPGPAHG